MSVEMTWMVGAVIFSLLCLELQKVAIGIPGVKHFIGVYLEEKSDFNPFHPNVISKMRVYLAWFGLSLCLMGYQNLGMAIRILACFGDAADSIMARGCGLITEKGKWLDPLCDKATYIPEIIYWSWKGYLSWELVMVFVALEIFGQFGVRKILDRCGWSGAANHFGKFKAVIAFCFHPYMQLLHNGQLMEYNFPEELLIIATALAVASIVLKFPVIKILKILKERIVT